MSTSRNYRCSKCNAHGCKLWRDYNSGFPRLMCCDCAGQAQDKNVSEIDATGRYPYKPGSAARTDQIGWMVPAVPDEEGNGYWGYSSVPERGVQWWAALPTRVVGR